MKLILGPKILQTEFEFSIFKKVGNLLTVDGKITRKIDKIGVYLSGGLDSAALLCLIIEELKQVGLLDTIQVLCFTVDKGEGQVQYAVNVVKEVEHLFNISLEHIIFANERFTNRPGRIGQDTYKKISEYTENIILYQGINNTPPPEVVTFNSTFEGYGNIKSMTIYSKTLLFPFLNLHKPQIIDILYQLNCSSVIKHTQTCTERSAGNCGVCYWCEERAWGFNMLEKIDPAKF
jgi:7-cyano-7-deazaguanine synthase in queuosine biosynthesis